VALAWSGEVYRAPEPRSTLRDRPPKLALLLVFPGGASFPTNRSRHPDPLVVTRLFSFRFDVDTHRCVREGMPALSRLGRRLDAPFTFFVNMGRAVSRRSALTRVVRGQRTPFEPVAAKHTARVKLGAAGWLQAALLNPRVGRAAPDVLRSTRDDGHEIGLHGGRNHAVWQVEALDWPRSRVAAEIDAVLPGLERVLGATPSGFASPGWVSPSGLPAVLAARGFSYLADLHGQVGAAAPPEELGGLSQVRTQLTGEPGGVAYLEHLDASGLSEDGVLRRFERDLEAAGARVAVYDHPYWAGVRALDLIGEMVAIARARGFQVVPLATVARAGVASTDPSVARRGLP
jgi:hypothetical protein